MFIIKDKKKKTITYDGGEADAYKKVVYGCYSSEADATFIVADIIEKETNRCISTEVTGFYFGTPEFEYTEKYQNTRKSLRKESKVVQTKKQYGDFSLTALSFASISIFS